MEDGSGVGVIGWLIYLVVIVVWIAGMWKVFEKAGQPGWAAIIPIYNLYVLTQVVGRPWWWLIIALIPLVNIIALFVLNIDLAKAFGKGAGYGVGLALLPFIFYPMLGFGDPGYQGAAAAA